MSSPGELCPQSPFGFSHGCKGIAIFLFLPLLNLADDQIANLTEQIVSIVGGFLQDLLYLPVELKPIGRREIHSCDHDDGERSPGRHLAQSINELEAVQLWHHQI